MTQHYGIQYFDKSNAGPTFPQNFHQVWAKLFNLLSHDLLFEGFIEML